MKRRKHFEAAALEAEQEAGLYGKVSKKPVGSYHYWKRLTDHFQLVRADVYRLEVEGQHAEWPEKEQRFLHWFTLSDAALLVDEPGLISLLLNLQGVESSTGTVS